MHESHFTWRELYSSSSLRWAEPHLAGCEFCQQRLLKLAYEDVVVPELPSALETSFQAHLELRGAQSHLALQTWDRLFGLAGDRVRSVRENRTLRHLPMAHILLQEATVNLRSEPQEARLYACFALDVLDGLEEPTYLVADAQAEAHLILAQVARRRGDLSGRHYFLAERYRALGTDCPRLSADSHSEMASYLVDLGMFSEALASIDWAIASYREQGARYSYTVALVKRSAVLSYLDPSAGAKEAADAVRWMKRRGMDDPALLAAALMTRIDCLFQLGQAQRALDLSTRYHKILFAQDLDPLFAARLGFLSARLLLRLGLTKEAELALGDAIQALERLHPQDATQAKVFLIHYLISGDRWEEAAELVSSADERLRRALRYPEIGNLWRELALHLLRSEPGAHAVQEFLRTLIEAAAR